MSFSPSPDLLWARLLACLDGREIQIIQRAYYLAQRAHHGQQRDGSQEPFIVHPLRVALILAEELNLTETPLLCTALLHDVLEDTDSEPGTIEAACGAEIARLVGELTKSPATGNAKATRDALYYLAIAGASPLVRLVKCADRLDNLRSMRELKDQARFDRYVAETRQYLLPVAEVTHPYLHEALSAICEQASDVPT